MSRGIPYRPIEPELIPVKVDTTELAAADSLAVASVQDSLQMAVADSMALAAEQSAAEAVVLDFTTFDAPVSEPATPYREATVEEVFGYGSVQAEIPFSGSTTPSPIATPAFGLLVLAIVAFYCLMLYQHLGDAVQLVGRVTRERASGERLSEDSNGDYSRFLTLCVILGVLLIGVASMRLVAPMLKFTPLALWPQSGVFWGALGVSVALAVVVIYQVGICLLVGRLTYTQHLLEQIFVLKRTFFALLTLLATPFLALWLLTTDTEGQYWFWVIIIELIISLVLYLRETLLLFISKKISILHWILYLCAVEIFPISLLILLVVR